MSDPIGSSRAGLTALDQQWDEFLWHSPRGQFQQTTGWARAKAAEGWSAQRVYLRAGEPSSGGFQVLWKRTHVGRVGFVNKGPVLPEETPGAVDTALEAVVRAAQELGLRVLVLQPPDASVIGRAQLSARGFLQHPLRAVIRSTAVVDLNGGRDAVLSRLSATTRRKWRGAERDGVRLRTGCRGDLPLLFDLISATCARQRVRPSPQSVAELEAIWDHCQGSAGLDFAEVDGTRVAAVLTLRHRDRLTVWKQGWDGTHPRSGANAYLHVEVALRAIDAGCAELENVGLSLACATSLLQGSGTQPCSGPDLFKIGLGARPRLLPPAQVYVTDRWVRGLIKRLSRTPRVGGVLLGRWFDLTELALRRGSTAKP